MVLPLTLMSDCFRNFASVREKVSLTVPNSAASVRLVMPSSIFTGWLALRIRAALHQPVRQARFDILERQVFKLGDEHAQMAAHRAEHPQRQFRLPLEQRKNPIFLHQQHLRRLQRARIGGIAGRRCQRHFGERVTGAENMDDLLLARGADAMDVHRAALHHVKSARRIAFVKKIIVLFQRLDDRDRRDVFQIRRRQTGEKLATSQRVDDGDLFQFCR